MHVLNPRLAIANHVLVSAVEISSGKDGTSGPNQREIPLSKYHPHSPLFLFNVSLVTPIHPGYLNASGDVAWGQREIKISKPIRKLLTVW